MKNPPKVTPDWICFTQVPEGESSAEGMALFLFSVSEMPNCLELVSFPST